MYVRVCVCECVSVYVLVCVCECVNECVRVCITLTDLCVSPIVTIDVWCIVVLCACVWCEYSVRLTYFTPLTCFESI